MLIFSTSSVYDNMKNCFVFLGVHLSSKTGGNDVAYKIQDGAL